MVLSPFGTIHNLDGLEEVKFTTALHSVYTQGQAQCSARVIARGENFQDPGKRLVLVSAQMSCAQINVTGGGLTNPSTVTLVSRVLAALLDRFVPPPL